MRRAEAEPRLRHPGATRGAQGQRDAEVRHQRLALVQQDVLGLDVPVDHALAVGVVERARHLGRDPHGDLDRELLLPPEPVAQRFALDVGHDVVGGAAHLAGVVQREDVGMLQVGGGLDLLQEPLGADHRGQLGAQHLEGHRSVVLQVAGEEDGRHPARAQFALQRIAVA